MKIIAFIMSLVVLLLIMQPAMALFNDPEETECSGGCCKNEAGSPAEDEHGEEDCGTACNPFVSCGGCGAYTADFVTFSVPHLSFNTVKTFACSQDICSQFSPDFWQPPRLSLS